MCWGQGWEGGGWVLQSSERREGGLTSIQHLPSPGIEFFINQRFDITLWLGRDQC
jgi:hypothetical protein